MKHTSTDREILRLAVPSIVTNVTVPLLGLADVTIMGHVGDARFIGAIAVGSMVFNVMYWLCGFLRMSTSGSTAQAFGAGSPSTCLALMRRSQRIGFVIAAAMLLMQVPLRWLMLFLMSPTADVAELVLPYYNICIWGAPAVLGLYGLTGWFIGMQDTRSPMLISIGQNIVNILLSVVLVFGFGLSIEGVAIGTVVAQWSGFAVALLLSRKKIRAMAVADSDGDHADEPQTTLSLSGMGCNEVYLFLRTLCLVSVNFYFTSAGAAQGAMMLAVNTLLMQLFMLFSYILDGFAYAGEALAGRYLGAGDGAGLHRVIVRLFGWGALMAALFTMVYAVGGQPFLSLLTSDAAVVAAAQPYLPWAVVVPVAGTAAFVWDGVMIGLTRARPMFVACVIAAALFFSTYALLRSGMGNHALWLAFILFLMARGVVQTIAFRLPEK